MRVHECFRDGIRLLQPFELLITAHRRSQIWGYSILISREDHSVPDQRVKLDSAVRAWSATLIGTVTWLINSACKGVRAGQLRLQERAGTGSTHRLFRRDCCCRPMSSGGRRIVMRLILVQAHMVLKMCPC